MFLLHHKKNASNHLFSKQLKNLQSNQLIVGFISIRFFSNFSTKPQFLYEGAGNIFEKV